MLRVLLRAAPGVVFLLAVEACSSDDAASVPPDGGDAHDAAPSTAPDATLDRAAPTEDAADAGAEAGDDDASSDGGDAGDAGADADADADAAPPPPPTVRYVGRFDRSDPTKAKVGWPGARAIARFSGTEARVTIDEQSKYTGPSRYDVVVDGVVLPAPLVATNGSHEHTIVSGLPAGTHTIELWRRTESQVGVSTFGAFTFPNGGQLLAPPPAPTRRIEVLGDSASNGYGIECASAMTPFSGATQNERRAYPGLMAKDLDADHHDLSFAGRGVLRNYVRNDPDVFEKLYARTLPESAAPTWDFATFPADVVWITLGGNDWDKVAPDDPPPVLGDFQAKYADLVALVRTKHPNAHIFCAVPPSLNDAYPAGWMAYSNVLTALTNVVTTRNQAPISDAKVHLFVFSRASSATDLTGCEYHANPAFHRKMADEAIAAIKAKTGWP